MATRCLKKMQIDETKFSLHLVTLLSCFQIQLLTKKQRPQTIRGDFDSLPLSTPSVGKGKVTKTSRNFFWSLLFAKS